MVRRRKSRDLRLAQQRGRFVAEFVRILNERELSLGQTAKHLRVTASYLSLVINGRRGIDLLRIPDWADRLGLSEETKLQLLASAVHDLFPERMLVLLRQALNEPPQQASHA